MINRVFLIVLDSLGIGEMPDAVKYGDSGCNTLASVSRSAEFDVPNLRRLGLFNIPGVSCAEPVQSPEGAFARMAELSNGKDTVTGHWEICGVVSPRDMPTYPDGFPQRIIDKFSAAVGREVLCNKPYSGTEVIKDYGQEHVETGKLIVYTSADSVFQIAAHEDVVPLDELYDACRAAREILCGDDSVGRVIARPFTGKYPNFTRTANRHDYALAPPSDTLLNALTAAGRDVIAVGKIYDIFAGSGIGEKILTKGNDDGMRATDEIIARDFSGLCFINLVDFDMLYGHRNDTDGYAAALSRFDKWLGGALHKLQDGDILMITGDHGCDPAAPGTDHTREYTPLIVYGKEVRRVNLGDRRSFADIGATIADIFGINPDIAGESFKGEIL